MSAKWLRLYGRLEKAIDLHREEMADSPLTPADEALYAAHEKVKREAAKRDG